MIKTPVGYAHVLNMTKLDKRSHAEVYATAMEKREEGIVISNQSKRARNIRRLIKYVISISGIVGTVIAFNEGFFTSIAMDLMWQGVLRNLGV